MTDDIEASLRLLREEINSMFATRTDYVIDAWGRSRDPRYNNETTFNADAMSTVQ
jgi:hypothetical protein